MNSAAKSDPTLFEASQLEELIDRDSLREVCRSFFDLFGLSIRVFSARGPLLANVHEQQQLCRLVNGVAAGRSACRSTVASAQALIPTDGATVEHPCFTGAVYHVAPIIYDDRQLGRIVLGPFVATREQRAAPPLLRMLPEASPDQLERALADMPRVQPETAARITAHLRGVLDLILFSGHRAQLTSAMHLASVRESYRELSEKNTSLQQAYEKLRELDRLKSNFLATVSHELRTPLTSIIGYSEMLLAGVTGQLEEQQHEFIDTIRNKGELLLSLITNLLDLNRLERGKLALKYEPVDPLALLMEIKSTYRPEVERRRLQLEVHCDQDTPRLLADPVRLRQVLLNLVGNALKFTADGGRISLTARAAELQLSEEEDDDLAGAALMMVPERAVEFCVRDTGIGMAEAELSKVFDAFYQVDGSTTREYGGAGLGLSIARNLVVAHHGNIRVESQLGRGTAFFVRLPETPPDQCPE